MNIKKSGNPPLFFLKRIFCFSLLFVALGILSGCGAKFDSELAVDANFKGSRSWIVSVSAEDLQRVTGGAAQLRTIARTALPKELVMEDLPADGTTERARFTMTFENLEEYQQKMQALLTLSGVDTKAEIQFSADAENPFKKGVSYADNCPTPDLFQWLFKAVEAQNITGTYGASDYLDGSQTKMLFNGQPLGEARVDQYDGYEASSAQNSGVVHSLKFYILGGEPSKQALLIQIPTDVAEQTKKDSQAWIQQMKEEAGVEAQWIDQEGYSSLSLTKDGEFIENKDAWATVFHRDLHVNKEDHLELSPLRKTSDFTLEANGDYFSNEGFSNIVLCFPESAHITVGSEFGYETRGDSLDENSITRI